MSQPETNPDFLNKLAGDFLDFVCKIKPIQKSLTYSVTYPKEHLSVERSARKVALVELSKSSNFVKQAFDTRKFNQETDRNPRASAQNYLRSDQFIDDELQSKLDIFARMIQPLNELKESFGSQPEWHDSYSRVLYDHVTRILRVKAADSDIFRPQIAYLEQLMFARYRLSMEELATIKQSDFKSAILKKDENLIKRGLYLNSTEPEQKKESSINLKVKDGNAISQESIINAIFGNNNFRRDGEKSVVRTITISIKDTVED